ncbi:bile acid:sodium symporter [Streptomyces sp. ventii]|uniref:Bile acid:sodium symporter n=2 Tax=Streptomyces spiramenti TaxID=2720606 RepID=A0ABX1AHM5_9ACTN|nr:bile acid:sodium symporter [Streptomyces spiramenti]
MVSGRPFPVPASRRRWGAVRRGTAPGARGTPRACTRAGCLLHRPRPPPVRRPDACPRPRATGRSRQPSPAPAPSGAPTPRRQPGGGSTPGPGGHLPVPATTPPTGLRAGRGRLADVSRALRFLDPYLLLLVATMGLAALLPAGGAAADVVDTVSVVAIGLLFFLYGARLSTREVGDGVRHWRLHLTILACTFVVFPLLGIAAGALAPWLLTDQLALGVLFLCLVPSTVQSSIAFTSIARGNVAGAIAAGSFSSLIGVVLTPLLAGLLIGGGAGISVDSLLRIALQLLLPFVVGQLLHRWLGAVVVRHRTALSYFERGSVLIVVYAAFSEGVREGVFGQVSWQRLLALLGVVVVLLALMLLITGQGARRLGFGREDRIAVVFAGSKKSLAVGLPMSSVLFGADAAVTVLPLMLFHQVQLIVCAVLARRWAAQAPPEDQESSGSTTR